jgi:hypothetical protein
MTSDRVTVKRFIVELLEYAVNEIRLVTAEATDEQLYYRPTAHTNSVAWLVWHLSRWRDSTSAAIAGEPQVWIADGWAQRFDLPNEATGLGDSSEQVAAFRVDRDLLFGYLEAAHRATVERVSRLTAEQLEQPLAYGTPEIPLDTRPAWSALASVCADSLQHTGQVNFLRGLVCEPGWRRQLGLY